MKKFIASLALAMLVCTGSIFAGTGGVPQSVNGAFNEKFAQAKDVKWETGKGFYKAEFEMRGRTMFVYFADNGDIMGIAGNLSPVRLPESLRSEIKKNYSSYWITDLFKYRNEDGGGFVVTLEGADKVIVLKALGDQGWQVYRTISKG
jgi:outer membrane lipoprotein-sorting protein